MKFLGVVLAALAAMAEGKRSISSSQIKTRMEKGQFNKATLMMGAKPYSNAARKMEEEEEEFEINGLYSVQFDSCLSMTVQNDEMFDDESNLIQYAAEGQLINSKSFILFSICYSSDCYYQSQDQKLTYITDIATYFQAFADFLPNQVESYCEGCKENEDYCDGTLQAEYEQQQYEDNGEEQDAEEEEQSGDEDGEQSGDEDGEQSGDEGDRRKLANNDRIIQMIDCDMCNAYECFEEEEEEEQGDDGQVVYEFEEALEWLDDLSQCQEMEEVYDANGNGLFAGLICNAEGDGVEIGVFYNEDCTMYSPSLAYSTFMSYADSQYFSMSEEVVEYMFTNDFSCYQPEIEYTNPYEYEQEEEDENDEEEEYQAPEAAEWCKDLFDGEMEAVNMYDCGADQNEEEEQEDEEEEYDQNLYYYDWYSYQLSEEQVDDSSEVCQAVKNLNGEYTTVYDKKQGGNLYNYKKNWSSNSSSSGMGSGGAITLVVLLVAAAGAAAAFVFKTDKAAGDKKAPLINNADGTMA